MGEGLKAATPSGDALARRNALRPASRERLVQRDRAGDAAGAAVGERVLRLQLHAFGVEHLEQAGGAGLEARARQSRGLGGVERGALEVRVLAARARVPHQRVLGILQRQQHRLLVARELALRVGVRGGDAGAHAADVEERPVDAERDDPRLAVAFEQRAAVDRLAADQAAEGEAREQVGGGDADARSGGVQARFRDGDVGAGAQQVAGRPGIDARRQRRQRLLRRERIDQRGRVAPGQHRNPVHRHLLLRFQCRDARRGGFQLRAGAGGVEVGAGAGIEARLHQVERLLLVVAVGAGDAQAFLGAAQVDVAARDLAGNRHLQRAQVGGAGLGLGAAGLDAAAHATEQVKLPARRNAGAPLLAVARGARRARRLIGAAAHVGGLALRGDRRQRVEARAAQQGVGAVVAGQRDAQVVVGAQGVLHQLHQLRIAEAVQEGVVEVRLRPRIRRGRWRRFAEAFGHRDRGADVVGADRARRQQRGRQRGDREAGHHGSASSR